MTCIPRDYILMIDVFCACIETGILPKPDSECHRKARELVDASGWRPKRKRSKIEKEGKA